MLLDEEGTARFSKRTREDGAYLGSRVQSRLLGKMLLRLRRGFNFMRKLAEARASLAPAGSFNFTVDVLNERYLGLMIRQTSRL